MTDSRVQELWNRAAAMIQEARWDEAAASLAMIAAITPTDSRVHYNLGLALWRGGDAPAGRIHLVRALEIEPSYTKAREALDHLDADAPTTTTPPQSAPDIASTPWTPPTSETTPLPDAQAPADDELPVAEMGLKAGVAIWLLLAVFMSIFASVSDLLGIAWAIGLTVVIGIIYASSTYGFIAAEHPWIAEGTDDPRARFLVKCLGIVSQRSLLPQPKLALLADEIEPNACTYGLSRRSAGILVTGPLLDHLQPTEPEMQAVFAHEMGHVRYGDFVVSTLLRFPIWLMEKIRGIAHTLLMFVVGMMQGVLEEGCGCGIAGIILVVGLLIAAFYLGWILLVVSAIIFICAVALNAYEREREYLADLYAARLMGSPQSTISALAKLQLASERIEEEIKTRVENAENIEDVDLAVAAPFAPPDPTKLIAEAAASRPTFWVWLRSGEPFATHPLIPNRIYFLHHPAARRGVASRLLSAIEAWVARVSGRPVCAPVDPPTNAIVIGLLTGICLSLLLILPLSWLSHVLGVLLIIAGGAALGWYAQVADSSGQSITRNALSAAFFSASIFFVVSTAINNRAFWEFLPVFILAAAANLIAGACLVARRAQGA